MMSATKTYHRVLVVEDEYFIADDVVRMLQHDGMDIAGAVTNYNAVREALDQQRVDVAVVDINLDGDISFEVAAELRRRNIPFLFLTGYDAAAVPSDYADTILLQKPYDERAVLAALQQLHPDTDAAQPGFG